MFQCQDQYQVRPRIANGKWGLGCIELCGPFSRLFHFLWSSYGQTGYQGCANSQNKMKYPLIKLKKYDFHDHFPDYLVTFEIVLNRAPAGHLPPAEHPAQVQDGSRGPCHRSRLGLQRLLLHPMDILQQGQTASRQDPHLLHLGFCVMCRAYYCREPCLMPRLIRSTDWRSYGSTEKMQDKMHPPP